MAAENSALPLQKRTIYNSYLNCDNALNITVTYYIFDQINAPVLSIFQKWMVVYICIVLA